MFYQKKPHENCILNCLLNSYKNLYDFINIKQSEPHEENKKIIVENYIPEEKAQKTEEVLL